MNCPECKTITLKNAKVKGKDVRIDYCTKCKGMWFEMSELELSLQAPIKGLNIPGESEPSNMLCPACFKQMYAFNYPSTLVSIDMCDKCHGVWLDAGQAKEIDIIRKRLYFTGKAIENDSPSGIKGALIRMIDKSISKLLEYNG